MDGVSLLGTVTENQVESVQFALRKKQLSSVT
jgi:hypothetical protein